MFWGLESIAFYFHIQFYSSPVSYLTTEEFVWWWELDRLQRGRRDDLLLYLDVIWKVRRRYEESFFIPFHLDQAEEERITQPCTCHEGNKVFALKTGIFPEPTPKSPISTIGENIDNIKHRFGIAASLPADWGPIMEVFPPDGSEEGVNGAHLGRAPLGHPSALLCRTCLGQLIW